jgi:ABC-type lipoprotein release transport system permease subunit
MVLTNAGRLMAVAIVIALPVAIAAGGALRSFLFEVTPADPATLLASALFVALTALVAADLPARRAAAVDPVDVIRGE